MNELAHAFVTEMLKKAEEKKQEVKFFLEDENVISGRILEYETKSGLITVFSKNCDDPPIHYFHESLVERFSFTPGILSSEDYGWEKTKVVPDGGFFKRNRASESPVSYCMYGDSEEYILCPSCNRIGPRTTFMTTVICPECGVKICESGGRLYWWK